MTGRRRLRRGEEGSALAIALVFVVVFSIFVASVISFAEVGMRASRAFASQAKTSYAADGAVNAAINRFDESAGCDQDYTAPVGPDGQPVNGEAMVVHCTAGARGSTPVNALLSLGVDPVEKGIQSTTDLRVLGDIVSNSTVRAGGTMVVQGEVFAQGDCLPKVSIQTSPVVAQHCSNSTPASPADPGLARDPDYTRPTSTVPVWRTVAATCPAEPVVRLEPGYYDDDALPGLNFLTTAGACPNHVIWFTPGLYYLDFTFLPGADTTDGTWTIAEPSVYVIGGTPPVGGWEPDGTPLPTVVPGSCRANGPGVQLVMGGRNTRLDVMAGKVELCSEPSTTDQQIAIFGLRADLATHVLAPTAVSGTTTFTSATNAMSIGEKPPPPLVGPLNAVARLTQAAPSATVTLKGFKPSIPTGSVIDSATLVVAHQDDPGVDSVTASATGEKAPCAPPHVLLTGAYVVDRSVDLKACGLTTAAAFANLEVTYTASTSGVATVDDKLDGIVVEVAYRPPTTRRPTAVSASPGVTSASTAFEIGERDATGNPLVATAALGGATTSASVTLAGMGDPPIPTNAVIDAAVLRVAHKETGSVAAGSPTISVGSCTGATARVLTAFADLDAGGRYREDRLDIRADCAVNTPAALATLAATYQITLNGAAATGELDGMWLELVYSSPLAERPATTAAASVFTTPTDALVVDAVTADATLNITTPVASLTMTGYAPPAAPAGPALDAAVLRVRHQDDGNAGPVSLSATWTGGGSGSCFATFAPHALTLADDRLDLKACGLTASALASLSVVYSAVLAGSGGTAASQVDGIVLDVAYAPHTTYRPSSTSAVNGFVNPDIALVIGETPTPLTADAAPGATAASVTLGGFGPTGIPPGSAIDSATLRVVHRDDGPVTAVGVTAVSTGGFTCGSAGNLTARPGALTVDTVDLAVCGLKAAQLAGLTTAYSVTGVASRAATNVAAASAFNNGGNAFAVDGASADALLDNPATPTAAITLDGYDTTAPVGATVDSAVLKIAHRDDSPIAPVTVDVAWGGTPRCTRTLTPRPAAIGLDLVSLAGCGLTALTDLAGLSVTYTANLTSGTTATDLLDGIELAFTSDRLDGVALDVVFRAPTFRPLSGGLTTGPYPGAGNALVKVAPAGGATRFVAKGTIYAPSAALDIAMSDLTTQVLTRGVIARAIRLGLEARLGYNRPTGGVPPEAVVFTAYPAAGVSSVKPFDYLNVVTFQNPVNAKAIDGVMALAPIDTTTSPFAAAQVRLIRFADSPSAGKVQLTGYPETLDDETVIHSAVVRVRHRDDAGIEAAKVLVDFPGNTCTTAEDLPLRLTLGAVDLVDLSACGLKTAGQITSLNVTYSAIATDPATTNPVNDELDGIELVVRVGPKVRARVTFDRGQATVQGWSVLR